MKPLSFLLAGVLLTGCCGPRAMDYAGKGPVLDARDYLDGDTQAWGVFVKRDGMADTSFTVRLHGEFSEREGTLHEDFTYSDGHTQEREWTFAFSDDHHFTGTAPDVIGTATGEQYGNAIHMHYVLRVPAKGKTYDLAADDWLYRIDDKHLINRNSLSAYGFHAGDLSLAFSKVD